MKLAAGNDSTSFKFDKQAFGRINNEKRQTLLEHHQNKVFRRCRKYKRDDYRMERQRST